MADDDGFDDESLLASVIAAERDAGLNWGEGRHSSVLLRLLLRLRGMRGLARHSCYSV